MAAACRIPFLFLLLFLGASLPAFADVVVLKNGDRITGEVKGKSGDRLLVRPAYADEVSIRWAEIASLSTSRPIDILLKGRSAVVRGVLQPQDGGGMLLVSPAGEAQPVALDEIASLNPKPYETDAGVQYAGRATVSAAYARGNVDSDHVYAESEVNARAKAYRYGLSARFDRRADPAVGTSSAWIAGANYDRFVDARRFGYVRGSLEHDRAKDLELRRAAGLGYGVQLIETARASLSVRAGLDHVAVERYAGPGEDYPALGWGVKAAYSPWGAGLEMFHEQEGFWNLDDRDAVTLRSKTGVRLPLIARLNATAQLNVDWEKRPAPGRTPTDATLLFGVDYGW